MKLLITDALEVVLEKKRREDQQARDVLLWNLAVGGNEHQNNGQGIPKLAKFRDEWFEIRWKLGGKMPLCALLATRMLSARISSHWSNSCEPC